MKDVPSFLFNFTANFTFQIEQYVDNFLAQTGDNKMWKYLAASGITFKRQSMSYWLENLYHRPHFSNIKNS